MKNRRFRWLSGVVAVLVLGSVVAGCAGSGQGGGEQVDEPQPTPDASTPGDVAQVDEPQPTVDAATAGGVVQADRPRLAPDAAVPDVEELAAGNSAFAFDLYQMLRQEGQGNLFYSPYSISAALAMTYAGARDETEQEMAGTLHFTLPQEQLHPAFNTLDIKLSSRGEGTGEEAFQLNIANAIWGQEGYDFLPAFLETLAENYGAGMRTLDFVQETEEARQAINDWVAEQTEGKIKDLIPPGLLSPLVRLVLTNAIYFNGKWVLPFEANDTRDEAFHLLDGSTVEVPMMSQTEAFKYGEGDGYQAVELPYRDSNLSMVLVLPEEGRFEEAEATLSAGLVDGIVEGLATEQVQLSVPKFKFESEFNLSDVLIEMGMPSAFGLGSAGGADFSGMTGDRALMISAVIHKTFVAVDEEGTEAAAATAVVMLESEMVMEDAVVMRLDRPFLFLIRDGETGTVLFVGRVMDPRGS
jgi:serpin B